MLFSINDSNLPTQKLLHDKAVRICKKGAIKVTKHLDWFVVVTYLRLTSRCISDRKRCFSQSVVDIATRRWEPTYVSALSWKEPLP